MEATFQIWRGQRERVDLKNTKLKLLKGWLCWMRCSKFRRERQTILRRDGIAKQVNVDPVLPK